MGEGSGGTHGFSRRQPMLVMCSGLMLMEMSPFPVVLACFLGFKNFALTIMLLGKEETRRKILAN